MLLIRRAKPPLAGAWSLPGGRIEWGEAAADAALRELWEETAVRGDLLGLIDVVDGMFAPDAHYILVDYAVRWTGGEPRAGDDATDAAFHRLDALEPLGLWPQTVHVIEMAVARFGAD